MMVKKWMYPEAIYFTKIKIKKPVNQLKSIK
jgi:hypothetical protein